MLFLFFPAIYIFLGGYNLVFFLLYKLNQIIITIIDCNVSLSMVFNSLSECKLNQIKLRPNKVTVSKGLKLMYM